MKTASEAVKTLRKTQKSCGYNLMKPSDEKCKALQNFYMSLKEFGKFSKKEAGTQTVLLKRLNFFSCGDLSIKGAFEQNALHTHLGLNYGAPCSQ